MKQPSRNSVSRSRTEAAPKDRNQFPVRGVGPIDGIFHDDEEELRLLHHMAQEAEKYLEEITRCKSVPEAYFGGGYGGVVAVFLFRVVPATPGADEWLWVIVGDLPPACLAIERITTPSEALEHYIWEMTRWVHFAKRGHLPENGIPINLEPTWKNAEELEDKLKILRKAVLPAFQANEAGKPLRHGRSRSSRA
ncbi:MAG TPA: hypothetical protein VN579_00455 [Bryobacteraceae bacterium]|nr:hypothetical protein [Bryobacteraceae bacterium]